jgi:uncharacterized protein YdiU (UPF0061 family)
MNLYFILEGDQTEPIVYPKWMEHILPSYTRVDFEDRATSQNYYIFSGGGIPSIYNHTINAIKNINENQLYQKLIVCLDSEEIGIAARKKELEDAIVKANIKLVETCELHIIVQNICIETWLLGNKRVVKKVPEGELLKSFIAFYNVSSDDPEKMNNFKNYRNRAHFHYEYLREVMKEHKIIYRKNRPHVVTEKTYLEELINRTEETGHISTFQELINLLKTLQT